MVQPYLGEIRMFGGNFAPQGWALCNGQQMSISTNDALFSLLGTTYGGDGHTYFNLPDLRGRVPLHMNTGAGTGPQYQLGQIGGVESVALTAAQLPSHSHTFFGANVTGNQLSPLGNLPANTSGALTPYINEGPDSAMNSTAITTAGMSNSHTNFQPYLCINFIIALVGEFPPQN